MSSWDESATHLRKTFVFADFPAAMAFMVRVSYDAQTADHHPEWTNIYNKVFVSLTSHDAGGVTDRDHRLAAVMDAVYNAASGPS
jgi:4a-hydroxytetrahydrobiopterin dehydratase